MPLKWTSHADLRIQRTPSLHREDYLDWMTFKGGDQIPFTEIFGPLIGLKEEWEEQGASPEELDFSAFKFREPRFAGVGVGTGRRGGPSELLEETADYALYRDDIGRVMRLSKGKATIPLPESWPVRSMDDWLKIKPGYLFDESRLPVGWEERTRKAREEGAVIQVGIPGGFDEPRQLMGEEANQLAGCSPFSAFLPWFLNSFSLLHCAFVNPNYLAQTCVG